MAKETGTGWHVSTGDIADVRPDVKVDRPPAPPRSRVSIALENVGVGLALLGVLSVFALFMTWIELGRWTDVLTWGGLATLGLFALGVPLIVLPVRAHRRKQRQGDADE